MYMEKPFETCGDEDEGRLFIGGGEVMHHFICGYPARCAAFRLAKMTPAYPF